ncbi:MAG: tetratricopeptide repeat protein [Desulfobacteraceae bacterium]|nr:tetratricopeptide repeat protein [Desulfobacteraceae bacterium]
MTNIVNSNNMTTSSKDPKKTDQQQKESRSDDDFLQMARYCFDLKQFDEAIELYKKSLDICPENANTWLILGKLYLKIKQPIYAMPCFQKAYEKAPDDPFVLIKLGSIFTGLIKLSCSKVPDYIEASEFMFGKVLSIDKDETSLSAYKGLSTLYYILMDHDREKFFYKKILEIEPENQFARLQYLLMLPFIYSSTEKMLYYKQRYLANLEKLIDISQYKTEEDLRSLEEAMATFPNFHFCYLGIDTLEAYQRYGRFVHFVMKNLYSQWSHPRPMPKKNPDGRIKIGFFSYHLVQHTVSLLFKNIITLLDPNQFEVYCYTTTEKEPEEFHHLNTSVEHFVHLKGSLSQGQCANRIYNDNLHFLCYPDIGMHGPTTMLAALRLAPVQCMFWGHPVTSGLPTMDYFLSSDLMEPENGQSHYSEKLIRMPNLFTCFESPEINRPKSRSEFDLGKDDFVYLSPQSLFKYLPHRDHLFPRIARQVSNAKIVFITKNHRQKELIQNRFQKAFSAYGLDFNDYCIFRPKMTRKDYLNLNMVADVLLDPLDWSGGRSTLEAISCGLPPVTCPGQFMRSRHTYAILKRMGICQTIAKDEEDYVNIAVKMAKDPDFYATIKNLVIKKRYLLYNDRECIDALESFFISTANQKMGKKQA